MTLKYYIVFFFFKFNSLAADKASTHLHHQAQISDVISLRLHQLQQNVTAAKQETGHVTKSSRRRQSSSNTPVYVCDGREGSGTYCLFLRMLVLRSSISSMGDEEERRELSEGLKEGELLSPCSTDSELGLSSRACDMTEVKKSIVRCLFWQLMELIHLDEIQYREYSRQHKPVALADIYIELDILLK